MPKMSRNLKNALDSIKPARISQFSRIFFQEIYRRFFSEISSVSSLLAVFREVDSGSYTALRNHMRIVILIVLDTFKNVSRDQDNILDQIYKS